MRNGIVGVVILACVDGDLHIATDMEFVTTAMDSLVVAMDEDLRMKNYISFFPGSEHVD